MMQSPPVRRNSIAPDMM